MKRLLIGCFFILASAVIAFLVYQQVDIVHRGGFVMVPILMCSMFALTITLERLFYFFTISVDTQAFFDQLREFVYQQKWEQADVLCAHTKGPLARVTRVGIRAYQAKPQEIESVMEEAAHEELPQLEQHHKWLSTIAQIATLLGLLGTVLGMVMAFQSIQQQATAMTPVSPADLAGGIWEALLTTAAGLEVAIPTILAYNYLAGRVEETQFFMEKAAAIIANWRHWAEVEEQSGE